MRGQGSLTTWAGLTVFGGLLAVGGSVGASDMSTPVEPPLFVHDDGLVLWLPREGTTLGDTLRAAGLFPGEADLLVPANDTPLTAVDEAFLFRQRTVVLRIGSEDPREVTTYRTAVGDILADAAVAVSRLDRVTPDRARPVADGETVSVTRVREETRTEEASLPPPLEVRADASLPLGTEVVEEQGTPGRVERTVHIRTENGKEIARRVLEKTTIAEPRPRIVRRGTTIVALETERGQASWYGGPSKAAAHRSFPIGTQLRIVRTDTGAWTLVTVVDRGPFATERVVDLSADAFRALAPLAAGIIPVNVERLP